VSQTYPICSCYSYKKKLKYRVQSRVQRYWRSHGADSRDKTPWSTVPCAIGEQYTGIPTQDSPDSKSYHPAKYPSKQLIRNDRYNTSFAKSFYYVVLYTYKDIMELYGLQIPNQVNTLIHSWSQPFLGSSRNASVERAVHDGDCMSELQLTHARLIKFTFQQRVSKCSLWSCPNSRLARIWLSNRLIKESIEFRPEFINALIKDSNLPVPTSALPGQD
jgi:hypothetical protein